LLHISLAFWLAGVQEVGRKDEPTHIVQQCVLLAQVFCSIAGQLFSIC
jgi:hypothetical protein